MPCKAKACCSTGEKTPLLANSTQATTSQGAIESQPHEGLKHHQVKSDSTKSSQPPTEQPACCRPAEQPACCRPAVLEQEASHPPSSPAPAASITTSRFRVENMCCEMEVALVRSLLEPLEGLVDVKVSSVGRVAVVRHRRPLTTQAVLDALNNAHLGASLQDTALAIHHGGESVDWKAHTCCKGCGKCLLHEWKRGLPWTLLAVGVVGLCLTIYMRTSDDTRLRWLVAAPFLVLCGAPLTIKALRRLIRRHLDVNGLMLVATVGALATGDVVEALAVLVLVMVGDRVREWCLDYVAKLLDESSGRLAPQMATLVDGLVLPVEAVRVGAVVVVKAGEAIPVDGVITQGRAAVDESAITGESCPVEKTVKSQVFGGTICQNGTLEIRCTAVASQSSIARIRDMVQEISLTRSPTQEMVDRFAQWYTPAIILVAALTAIVSLVLHSTTSTTSADWRSCLYRGLTVLVLGCPCALVLSAPLPTLTSLAASANVGRVLFKSATALETLGRVKLLACDKTGTLTEGRLRVTGKLALSGAKLPLQLASKLTASVESMSSHPLADALVFDGLGCITTSYNKLGPKGALAQVRDFKIMEGIGVSGTCLLDGMQYKVVVGNEFLLEDGDMDDDTDLQDFLKRYEGEAKIYVLVNGVPEMVCSVADTLRASVEDSVKQIHSLGVETALLTGDCEEAATRVQRQVGLGCIKVRMKPVDKLEWIRGHQQEGCRRRVVAMLGDGINDGPSLMAADVGISMGARGTALAVASSDVVLMSDSIHSIPQAIRMSRAVNKVVVENVILAVGIKSAVLILVFTGQATLWLAVASDAASLLAVVLNGMKPLCLSQKIFTQ